MGIDDGQDVVGLGARSDGRTRHVTAATELPLGGPSLDHLATPARWPIARLASDH